MINEAMFYDRDKLNPFTTEVKRICIKSGKCLVKLRNNTFAEIFYIPANEENDEKEGFRGKDWEGCWFPDGSSLTSDDYDMVENIDW